MIKKKGRGLARLLAVPMALAASAMATAPAPAATAVSGDSIEVDTRLSHRVLKRGITQKVFVRVGIKGALNGREQQRTPANIALVIDRSGSMQGERIAHAREAANMAIDRMTPRDIASVVAFDDKIDVLVRAGNVEDHQKYRREIERLESRGSTAIYAAVQAAAREVRKFKSPGRMSRIILMSDGLANVGPSQPSDFERLGRELGSEGISVTTIGLGSDYNEDLMSRLAHASDGNHAFARSGADLTRIFNSEFDDVLSVTAQEIELLIETRSGVRPLRSLGRESEMHGNTIRSRVQQIYGSAQHSLQFELEVPADVAHDVATLADITVSYRSQSGDRMTVRNTVTASFTDSENEYERGVDPIVMEPIVELEARERSKRAVDLRDAGRAAEAKAELQRNVEELSSARRRYKLEDSPRLKQLEDNNAKAIPEMDDERRWQSGRKAMRQDQYNAPASEAAPGRHGASTRY